MSNKKTTEAATLAAEAEEDATPFTAVSRADAEGLKLLLQSDPTAFDPSAPSLPTKSKKKKGGNLNSGDFSTVSLLLGEGARSEGGVKRSDELDVTKLCSGRHFDLSFYTKFSHTLAPPTQQAAPRSSASPFKRFKSGTESSP